MTITARQIKSIYSDLISLGSFLEREKKHPFDATTEKALIALQPSYAFRYKTIFGDMVEDCDKCLRVIWEDFFELMQDRFDKGLPPRHCDADLVRALNFLRVWTEEDLSQLQLYAKDETPEEFGISGYNKRLVNLQRFIMLCQSFCREFEQYYPPEEPAGESSSTTTTETNEPKGRTAGKEAFDDFILYPDKEKFKKAIHALVGNQGPTYLVKAIEAAKRKGYFSKSATNKSIYTEFNIEYSKRSSYNHAARNFNYTIKTSALNEELSRIEGDLDVWLAKEN